MLCASAIYRLAEEEESRDLVRMHGGLEPLVELIQEQENQTNKVSLLTFFTRVYLSWMVNPNLDYQRFLLSATNFNHLIS